MAAPIQTLALDSHYSIFRDILAPQYQAALGGGVVQRRRQYQRPSYRFRVHDSMAVQAQAEYLYSFLQYHQGDIPFWWTGGPWGSISTPILVGFGDGSRTQFLLNNRWITPGTLHFFVDVVEVTSPPPTLDAPTGLVTLSATPTAGQKLTATYDCTYKVFFAGDAQVLQSEEQFYSQLFKYEGIALQESII